MPLSKTRKPQITIKIMLLQHDIKYHEAHDWIRLYDPSRHLRLQNTSPTLQATRTMQCEQFQKAQQRGRAELTTLANASATHTSIHQDAIPTHQNCHRCRYNHNNRDCPARKQRCYKCNNLGHFSHLCKARYMNRYREDTRRSSHRR